MKVVHSIFILFLASAVLSGCGLLSNDITEKINLSEGIEILINQDGAVVIGTEDVPVDKVMDKLLSMKVRPTDVIVIKVSPRASQRPVLQILDQLGDAKFNNITITSAN